jgi:hypothetical protein
MTLRIAAAAAAGEGLASRAARFASFNFAVGTPDASPNHNTIGAQLMVVNELR